MKFLTTLVAIAMLGLVGCGGEEEGEPTPETETETPTETPAEIDTSLPGDANAGAEVYQRICVACHGADGTGNGGVTGGNFVGQPERLQQDNETLLAIIRDGKLDVSPPMPAHGQVLSEQEMKDALSYIRREFGQE